VNQGDSDVQGLRRAGVVTYDPVRRVGKLKLVPERGRDLQFFLSVLEGKLILDTERSCRWRSSCWWGGSCSSSSRKASTEE